MPQKDNAMHDLRDVRRRAEALMETLGAEHLGRPLQRLGWRVEFDRARRRLGMCKWKKRGRIVRVISLSRYFTERLGWDEMEDVVRHEIAHAIDYETRGRSAHDATWRRLAQAAGADPTRLHEGTDFDDPESKYVGICGECDARHPFYRRVRRVHACPDCCRRHNGGRFTRRYRLHIVERESGRIIQEAA